MAVFKIELLVRLKTADTVALTARNTLQRDLGYKSVLVDLRREDYWLIEAEAGSNGEAESLGRELATVAKIFVNPNKHTYNLRVAQSADGRLSPEKASEKPPYDVRLLVRYRQDEKAVIARDTLRDTYGYGKRIKDVRRGVLWNLTLNTKNLDTAKKIAEEISLTSSMERGLLANPHSQTYAVL